ncbi:MAG: polysaccharide deacetylase family protein [Clostridia bacterium]|nr:polysaccharide deacetylase family protein [Clostridia bacterium]
MIALDVLKNGTRYAMTVSYDDGANLDRRLLSIFNEYGIRGTWHLNSGSYRRFANHPDHIQAEELAEVYRGHEVACHGVGHNCMYYLENTGVIKDIYEDRRFLEQYVGYPIRGLSYANNSYRKETIDTLRSCGIVYSRTTQNTGNFLFPQNWMEWAPTCHQPNCLKYGEMFLNQMDGYFSGPKLFYVWGHSHEFGRTMEWETIERKLSLISWEERLFRALSVRKTALFLSYHVSTCSN